MHYYADVRDGKVVAVLQLAGPVDVPSYVPIQEFDEELIGATYDGTSFVRSTKPVLYVHASIAGGDGDDPPGAALGSTDAFTVRIAVRSGPDADAPVVPVEGRWRITLRRSDGSEGDVVRVRLTQGEAAFTYVPNDRMSPGTYSVSEADFADVKVAGTAYAVRLATPIIFKLYRDV